MIDRKQEIEQLSPEAQKALKQQRSRNRIFGLLCFIALVLFVIFIYEIVVLAKK